MIMRLHVLLSLTLWNGGPLLAADQGLLKPVLVELFTSEGCSSCPPADTLLEKLDKLQPIDGVQVIVMSEHVDYWNRDGWTDPFSSPEFSARQTTYGSRLKSDSYTPQMVVDGSRQCLGNRAPEVEAAIREASKTPKLVMRIAGGADGRPVRVEVDAADAGSFTKAPTVYAAVAKEEGENQVLAGENRGRRLHHVAVVRKFRKLGKLAGGSGFEVEISPAPQPGERLIAFVQEPGTGRILGAAEYKVPR